MNRISKVFGLSFCNISLPDLGAEILRGAHSGDIIVTPNVDHVVRFHHDEVFRSIYKKADLFVNDSRILKKLSSMGLQKIESLVPGSDLTAWLFKYAPKDLRITVIGASVETINVVSECYKIKNLHHYNPPMGFMNEQVEVNRCLSFCEKYKADITFLAVGSPRQEELAFMLKNSGGTGAFLCVGASLLFLSGEEKRAPRWIQLLHSEWFFRLLLNPRRLFRRYLIEGPSIFKIYLRELIK
jgi:N-acetylglucosaminyldiphosphoundecaprenol N-acetyl-beta-D-mannosaminyltransferase